MRHDGSMTAIVLAAGLSERMGRFKPLLPLGGKRVIQRVVNLYRDSGVEDVLVVVGKKAGDVRQAIASLNVRCVINPAYINGMFTSVVTGIRNLPPQSRAFFIHPVDIPLVRPQTIGRLAAAFIDTSFAVVYPTFDGRRGHPPLIHSSLAPQILKWPGTGGLQRFLHLHDAVSCELAVADEGVLMDLDTPEDYHCMQNRLNGEGLPSAKECRVLMSTFQALPPSLMAHCRTVASVAGRLATALQAAGVAIDIELTRTAALLHDIARMERDHARIGAQLLESHGFGRLAPIVAAHMDLEVIAEAPVDEAQIVYLADKLVSGDCLMNLERRFSRKLETYGQNPLAMTAIIRRRENARRVRDKVERITGDCLDCLTGTTGALEGGKQ